MARISARDCVGKPLKVGDVVVYSPGLLQCGVVADIESSGVVWIRRPRILQNFKTGGVTRRLPGTWAVVAVPHALAASEVRRLRAHKLRHDPVGAARKRARRREENERWRPAQPIVTSGSAIVTPEATLTNARLDDARQAEYQRRMSALLAGRP